jgi:hypothetical protein
MVVRGQAPFWLMRMDGTMQCVSIEGRRVDAQQMEETCAAKAAAIFLCCRNYTSGRNHLRNRGMLGMLKQADTWKLISLYEIDVSENVLQAFQYTGGISSPWSDQAAVLQSLEPLVVSLEDIKPQDLHWVNQCYGKAPFQSLAKDIVNPNDNKFQCSVDGPDYLPIFNVGTDFKVRIPSHFKTPEPLFSKRLFRDKPSTHLPGGSRKRKRHSLSSRRKSTFDNPDFSITTLYCEISQHLKEINLTDTGVVIGEEVYNISFTKLDKIKARLESDEGMDSRAFKRFIKKYKSKGPSNPFMINLEDHPNGIRIKVVPSSYFDSLPLKEEIYHGPCGRIHQGVEKGDKWFYPGLMISFLHVDSSMHPFDVSWELASLTHRRMGKSFDRNSIVNRGLNKYLGRRRSAQASQSPVCGPGSEGLHNYHWEAGWDAVVLPLIHRTMYSLVEKAVVFGSRADPSSHRVVPGGCEQTMFKACSTAILTLNFFCGQHIDRDQSTKTVRRQIVDALENIKRKCQFDAEEANYLLGLEELGGLGRMTTCGYQFIKRDATCDKKFVQHFLFDGVGVAVRLCDHAGVAFYGHMVSHRTAMPLLKSPSMNWRAFMPHLDNGHIVFAWGAA